MLESNKCKLGTLNLIKFMEVDDKATACEAPADFQSTAVKKLQYNMVVQYV